MWGLWVCEVVVGVWVRMGVGCGGYGCVRWWVGVWVRMGVGVGMGVAARSVCCVTKGRPVCNLGT